MNRSPVSNDEVLLTIALSGMLCARSDNLRAQLDAEWNGMTWWGSQNVSSVIDGEPAGRGEY